MAVNAFITFFDKADGETRGVSGQVDADRLVFQTSEPKVLEDIVIYNGFEIVSTTSLDGTFVDPTDPNLDLTDAVVEGQADFFDVWFDLG